MALRGTEKEERAREGQQLGTEKRRRAWGRAEAGGVGLAEIGEQSRNWEKRHTARAEFGVGARAHAGERRGRPGQGGSGAGDAG